MESAKEYKIKELRLIKIITELTHLFYWRKAYTPKLEVCIEFFSDPLCEQEVSTWIFDEQWFKNNLEKEFKNVKSIRTFRPGG